LYELDPNLRGFVSLWRTWKGSCGGFIKPEIEAGMEKPRAERMTLEPRNEGDYSGRQTKAARRVLVDLGQVLASFVDCLVVVGGWTPDLLLPDADEPHVGSIDVDLALDAAKLNDGRYAELVRLLLDTKRYRAGEKDFQLVVEVDLKDGERPVQVDVEFLAPKGATNTVRLRVASLADFLVMKAHAIGGRDKPKDTYDFCYCLEQFPDGMEVLAADWRTRDREKNIARAVEILREKFNEVNAFGPQQLVEFHAAPDLETQEMHARRAYELVQKFLRLISLPK
jgi:hypothetical protein